MTHLAPEAFNPEYGKNVPDEALPGVQSTYMGSEIHARVPGCGINPRTVGLLLDGGVACTHRLPRSRPCIMDEVPVSM